MYRRRKTKEQENEFIALWGTILFPFECKLRNIKSICSSFIAKLFDSLMHSQFLR